MVRTSPASHRLDTAGRKEGRAMEVPHREVEKIRASVRHCSGAAADGFIAERMLGADATDLEKAEWVHGIVADLERRFDEEIIRDIRKGCHCDEEGRLGEMKKWLGGLYRESGSIEEFVARVNGHGAGWYIEDGWLYTKFLTCECYMLRAVPRLSTKTWCHCTEGYTAALFRDVLGREVESELVQTIKMGHEFCVVRIRIG